MLVRLSRLLVHASVNSLASFRAVIRPWAVWPTCTTEIRSLRNRLLSRRSYFLGNSIAERYFFLGNTKWLEDQYRLRKLRDYRLIMESTQTAASAVSFSLWERFRSFGELEDKLKRYEESTFTEKRLQNSGSRHETHGQTAI